MALTEVGALGVFHLRRLWQRTRAMRDGWISHDVAEDQRDRLVLDALGLGLEQARRAMMEGPATFPEFEEWVVAVAGRPEPEQVERLNRALTGAPASAATRDWLAAIDAMAPVLNAEDLAQWEELGYVILPDAVPEASRRAAEQAIWTEAGAAPTDPSTWYGSRGQGIMLQLFQHPAFAANRRSPRIHKAFAQIWGTADLWVTCDRGGFNAPLRPGTTFAASDLHWDASLARPMAFGTQGILYLTDTPPEQGAFRCIPGFHRRLDEWLDHLPPGRDPREENLHVFGPQLIGGRAGDLIIWNDKLPHGASPNHGRWPRIVQYLNMYPADRPLNPVWR